MKKLFYVLAIAAFAACNNEEKKAEEVKPDTTQTTPAPDTSHAAMPDSGAAAKPDSAAAAK